MAEGRTVAAQIVSVVS